MKKVVPLHDDLFDFFYEAMPGYEKVGLRRTLLGVLGLVSNDPDVLRLTTYKDMAELGQRKMFVTPGVVVDGKLVTHSPGRHQPRIYEFFWAVLITTTGNEQRKPVRQARDPLGNPVDKRHPWNQHTLPAAAEAGFGRRQLHLGDVSALVRQAHRRPSGARHRRRSDGPAVVHRAGSGLVDIGYVKSTGHSVQINLPKTALKGPVEFEWKIPQHGSNTIERDRARTYFQAYAAACALHFAEKALVEIRAGRTKTWEKFEVPKDGIGCGFTEAVRGVLSHHMVIRDGKIANYHPYPPTPWNANPRDSFGTPGPYEDAVQGQPIFEENDREHFKGIDIMRTVRSFDPCLPCGVHMYLGKGKTLERLHSPTQAATGE